jgi:Zn-dependent protease with chaperone function
VRGRDVIAGLLVVLLTAVLGVAYVASQIDGTLSAHGWIAFGLGVGATLLLAVGLVALMFFSRRRGYDDDAGHP